MSVTIETILKCDGPKCYATYRDGDARENTANQQRRDSADEGWIRIVSKDYCPACKVILFPNRKERQRKLTGE